jgi:hypothetical protein
VIGLPLHRINGRCLKELTTKILSVKQHIDFIRYYSTSESISGLVLNLASVDFQQMAPKRVFIDLTNDLNDTTNRKRRVVDTEQSSHRNISSEKDILRVTARKLEYDVTCSEVLGDNVADPPCRDISQSLDKYKPSFVCFGSVSAV